MALENSNPPGDGCASAAGGAGIHFSSLAEVAGRIAEARRAGRPVIWMIGAHVVKRGLAPLLIDLMERGVITHLASNGASHHPRF